MLYCTIMSHFYLSHYVSGATRVKQTHRHIAEIKYLSEDVSEKGPRILLRILSQISDLVSFRISDFKLRMRPTQIKLESMHCCHFPSPDGFQFSFTSQMSSTFPCSQTNLLCPNCTAYIGRLVEHLFFFIKKRVEKTGFEEA